MIDKYGYLEKLSFCPNSALHAKILSSEYHLYGCGKIFTRALILNQNPNFARYPLDIGYDGQKVIGKKRFTAI